MNGAIIKNNKSGFGLLRPYSSMGGGLFALLIRGLLSAVSALMVFNLIFYSFHIECDYALMTKIIFGISFLFTLLQLNTIVLVLGLAFAVFKIYNYISANTEIIKNGLKTMANQCYPIISNALNLPLVDGFNDIMADTYLTVNTVSAIVVVGISIIMTIVVVKLNSTLFYAIGMSFVFAFLSFFNCEIDFKYAAILLLSFLLMTVLNLCGISSFKLSVVSLLLRNKGNKGKFKADIFFTVQVMFICCIVFVIIGGIFRSVYPQDKFNATFNAEYSENIKITARDIAVIKYAEYKDFNLTSQVKLGQLSYISYNKPNFKSNAFRFVTEPIREGKIYFTAFVGERYNYRYNDWTESGDNNNVMVDALKNAGADEKVYEIYSPDHKSFIPGYAEYKSYNYNDKNKVKITSYEYKNVSITDEGYNNYVNNTYLSIDEENKKIIDKICSENGFSKDDLEIDKKLSEYLKNNFTYSTETDTLPYGKDFVNYFLEESKTGNFTHYASALTLLYRNIGIPARYVSGYVVEAKQTIAGANEGGQRTNTAVKSANLHSWVEVYSSNGGWRIIDNIPSPTMEELEEKYGEKAENTYSPNTSLDNYFRTIDKEKYSPVSIVKTGIVIVVKFFVIIFLTAAALSALLLAVIYICRYMVYIRSDNSKKAYILMEGLKRKYKINEVSYRGMQSSLAKKFGREKAYEIITLAEKCIFSDKVTDNDIKKLKKLLR